MDDYPDPITPAGRVAPNGLLDRDEIRIRQATAHNPERPSMYGGMVDDQAYDIFQFDMCVEVVRPDVSRIDYAEPQPFVLSVLNGAFSSRDTVATILPRLQFRGFASAEAKYDPSNNETQLGLALQQGGLITIKNTGPKNIRNGDWVYFDVPDPRNPYEKNPRGSGRIVFVTKPYDPMQDKVFSDTLASGLSAPNGVRQSHELAEGAKYMRQAIVQAFHDAFFAFATSGLMKFDPVALTPGAAGVLARSANAQLFTGVDVTDDQRVGYLRRLAIELGLRGFQRPQGEEAIKVALGAAGQQISLDQYVMDVFLGMTPSALMAALVPGVGTRELPAGSPGQLVMNQQAALSNMVDGIVATNFSVRRRVFGRAMSSATPGNKFDVFLGGVAS